jgi:GTP-binding protein Era
VLALLKSGVPALLIANKLDTVHRRAEIAPWLLSMQQRHTFAEFVPMSAKNAKDIERLFGICEKYLPEQPWAYGEDELTDRSERFLASEIVREKQFRFTGDELPYTSTVVIDKFEDEFGRNKSRLARIACHHRRGARRPQGDGDRRRKASGSNASAPKRARNWQRLMDCKVFLELWVKVRSGWADDEARVRVVWL